MRSLLLLLAMLLALTGCSNTPNQAVPSDAGTTHADAGKPPPSSACFTNPHTYLEIINACTDAQAVDKTDNLSPMNLPDGGLQPLP